MIILTGFIPRWLVAPNCQIGRIPVAKFGRCGHSNSLAVAYAESMIEPYHPGSARADPDVQAQRSEELDKQQREIAAYHEQAARDQEERVNREELERFATVSRRP